MNQLSAENFGVVLIENNALGVCIFDSERLSINCGQILYFTSYDKSLLAQVFFDCQQIITNQSKHVVLSELKERLTQFKGQLKVQSINFIIKELPTLKKNKNKDAYIQMMYEESPIKFKALGMALNHLINETVIYKRQEIRFDDIQFWKDYVFQHVQITYSQMKYLQIATESLHPSLVKTRADNSLGNSVLKIYDSFLRINGSKRFLKRLMYNPIFCKKEIQKRQTTIQWIVKFMNDQKFYKRIFNSIFAIESIIVRFQSNKIQEEDWRKLAKSIQSIIELRNSLPLQNVPDIVKSFIDKPYWPNLSKVIKIINKTIDVAPFGIKYGYDKQLERLKDMLGRLPAIMTKIENQNEWGQFADLVFLPQIGYLVSVPHQIQNYPPEQLLGNWENHTQEQLQDEDSNLWQLKFTNYTGRFYSNPVTRQLNEKFGDIKGTIRDIERRILDELQQEILAISQELKDVYWTVVQIQTFYGIAQLSRCMARPRMSSQELIIQDGWNMLLGQNAVQNHAFMFEHEKGPKNKGIH